MVFCCGLLLKRSKRMIDDAIRIIGIQSVTLNDNSLEVVVVLATGECAATHWPLSVLRRGLGIVEDEDARAPAATVN